jgi:hypothetical protein
MNPISRHPQAFSYPIGHLAFADKGVNPGRASCLLPGVQLANQNDDDGSWADCP